MRRPLALLSGPLVLGFAAAGLGSLALFAMALGLVVILVGCGLATRIAAARLRVVRTIDRHEVLEGHPVTLHFKLAGLRGWPVHVEVLTAGGKWVSIGADQGSVAWTVDRPGGHVLEPSPLRVRDDFGLLSRRARGGEPESLLVLPVPAIMPGLSRRGGVNVSGDPEPDGLRPYVPGTPMSRIHWPTAARGGPLQERSFVSARDHLPLVIVDTGGAPAPESVDWAARMAAGHVLALVRNGGCRVLLPGDRVPTTLVDQGGQWPAIHRRLAALELHADGAERGRQERDTVVVSAAGAPLDALTHRGVLPPGVVPLASWTAAA